MNSGLTRGSAKITVSFPYGLTPFRGRTFLNTPYRCVEVSGLPTLRHLMHIQRGCIQIKSVREAHKFFITAFYAA